MREFVGLAVFLLAVYGLSTAVAVLKIGRYFLGVGHCTEKDCVGKGHPRDRRRFVGRIPYVGDLFYCPPCLAFWFGAAFSWWILSPAASVGVTPQWRSAAVDGLAACAVSWLLHAAVMRLITRQCPKCGHVDGNIPEI